MRTHELSYATFALGKDSTMQYDTIQYHTESFYFYSFSCKRKKCSTDKLYDLANCRNQRLVKATKTTTHLHHFYFKEWFTVVEKRKGTSHMARFKRRARVVLTHPNLANSTVARL